MTPSNPLSNSTDSLAFFFETAYSTSASFDNVKYTHESTYEKLTGKPYNPDDINFIEANIYEIFQAVQNKDTTTFQELFNLLSKDPVNQFLLLQRSYELADKDSYIATKILWLKNQLFLEYPEYKFAEIDINESNDLKWKITREHLGKSLITFKNTLGVEFHQDKADLADNWIFDIFAAIENADIKELNSLLGHVEFAEFHNMLRILGKARILSETLANNELKDTMLVNDIVTKAEKTLRKMKNLPNQPALNKNVLGYNKENDAKLIARFQEIEKQDRRSNTSRKIILQSINRFAFPDPDLLQLT